MSETNQFQDQRAQRVNEAAAWFLRLKDDEVDDQDLSCWMEWCATPENLREFRRIRHTWRSFGDLQPAATAMLEALQMRAESAVATSSQVAAGELAPEGNRGWAGLRPMGLAAALIMAVGLSAGAWHWHGLRRPVMQQTVKTSDPPPAIRSSMLPDGSTLTLAPRTEVAVEFGATQRKLTLSHGEAYFKVHPDKTKPFVVQASGLSVAAVGTAFDVRSRADRIVVTVQEGIVEVARVDGAAGQAAGRWRVNAGYQVSYNVKTGGARIAAVDAERALAWREGRLEYFSEPLGSVVADVSRYSAHAIEIGDPQLAKLTFTGTVFTSSVNDWLAAVQATFPIKVVSMDGKQVLWSSRAKSPAQERK